MNRRIYVSLLAMVVAFMTVSETASAQRFRTQSVPTGNLYVSLSTTPVRNRQVLGGQLSAELMRLRFKADVEPIYVTNLQLTVPSNDAAASIDRLELYKLGATVPFATATIAGCGTTTISYIFCAKIETQKLLIPKDQNIDIAVRALMKSDTDGALPGKKFHILLVEGIPSITVNGSVSARGVLSKQNLKPNDGDALAEGEIFIGRTSVNPTNVRITGPTHATVLSKITSITNANPDANGTSVPTGVSPIGQFKIAAAPHGNSLNGLNRVTLADIIFTVSSANVQMDGTKFKMYNKADQNSTQNCSAINTTGATLAGIVSGSFFVQCTGLTGNIVNSIDQGSDQTFVLQGTVTNPMVGGSSALQVSLQDFTSLENTTFGFNTSHFGWIDRDNGSSTTAKHLWVEYPQTSVRSTAYAS